MIARWSKMPKSCGGGYGIPQDMEVYIDRELKADTEKAILTVIHEVTELHLPISQHCQLDILADNLLDSLKQLKLI